MPQSSTISATMPHRKRRFQDISKTCDAPVTPSVSDSDSVGPISTIPTEKPAPKKNSKVKMEYIVGLDFGTTMTSISYYGFKSGKRPAKVIQGKIRDIKDWPSAGRDQQRGEVPSESLYLDGNFYWGYQARQKLEQFHYSGGISDPSSRLIKFTKLLLPEAELNEEDETDNQLRQVRETLRHLGKSVYEAVEDYLIEVFQFAKSYLADEVNFTESSVVELCLSVPAGWPIEASWSLQQIAHKALTQTTFGELSGIFIVNEPEAASAFALDFVVGGTNVSLREIFMVCDAGGGTVDVTTYKVEQKSPFRLIEAVTASGGNFGSTSVNRAMESDLIAALKNEPCFSKNNISIENQLSHSLFRKFENEVKRNFDYGDALQADAYLELYGLEENASKGFGKGMIILHRDRIMEWFMPSLERIAALIQQQLDACAGINLTVQKIILFGGYARSKTLQSFLKQRFSHTRVISPKDGNFESTVSRGTVYRATNKENGPVRRTIANVGILQTEPFNPKKFAAHREALRDRNDLNKKEYVYNTVQWIIKKGEHADYNEPVRESNHRVIPVDEPWEIKQSIYYNTLIENPEDHYPLGHPRNSGSRWADTVVFDLSTARELYPLPVKGKENSKYYEVHYDLLVQLHGRNLNVSIVYPPGGEVQGSKEIAVAAWFPAGAE
ncbi:hypothetical protein N7478_011155 [Penicillium angulare]|uniref:uncharacterized protein n=1 Tax=Penicillium angulare TaxID=116970 RepID=UPI002541EE2B|nr:uncharacterized protein N7478_011155 [Penicillium angulare]KAJ5263550.1 hypothetical protein N7478_011155 [Penicillium angulare]